MSVVRESVKEMLINRFYHDDGRERVRKAFPSLFHKGQMRVDNLGDEDEEEDAPFDEEAYERDYEKLAAALGETLPFFPCGGSHCGDTKMKLE